MAFSFRLHANMKFMGRSPLRVLLVVFFVFVWLGFGCGELGAFWNLDFDTCVTRVCLRSFVKTLTGKTITLDVAASGELFGSSNCSIWL